MRLALVLAAAALWQAGDLRVGGPAGETRAEPQYLRYERSLTVPGGAAGEACAVIDANVYAHAAGASVGDLRVFQLGLHGEREVPFAVSFSEAQPTDAMTAAVRNPRLQGSAIAFDMEMPERPYTTVNLELAAKNFVATAEVWGSDAKGGQKKALGTFVLFDLTREGLARSTAMALQESAFAQLHVVLRMQGIDGGRFGGLSAGMVRGAAVPASREAQTLYTVVATSGKIAEQEGATVARIGAPAHVPVERLKFVLRPGYKGSFLRAVSVTAARDAVAGEQESVDGTIWRVRRAAGHGVPAIDAEKLTMEAVIASNMREPAAVTIAVKHGSEPPIPFKAVQLEMRQRSVCFGAVAGASYELRYGDSDLRAAGYEPDGLKRMQGPPMAATLGAEELNRRYVTRKDAGSGEVRSHDEQMYWVVLLAAVTVFGAMASRHTKRQGRHR